MLNSISYISRFIGNAMEMIRKIPLFLDNCPVLFFTILIGISCIAALICKSLKNV